MRKKSKVSKLKPTAHKLGHHPDLRTKAGRAWKAKQAKLAADLKARKREAARAEAALAVSGSWEDFSGPLFAEARASLALDRGEGQTHYEGDRCPGGHLHDGAAAPPEVGTFHQPFKTNIPTAKINNISPEDFARLEATGMAWELYPEGPSRAPSAPGAYSKVMV